MSTSVVSSKTKWKEFLTNYHKADIQAATLAHKSLIIPLSNLYKYDFRLYEAFIEAPDKVLKDANAGLMLVDIPVKNRPPVPIRFVGNTTKVRIRDLRSEHINTFVTVEGTVRQVSDTTPRITVGAFECARCGNQIILPQEGSGKFLEPAFCPCNEDRKGIFRLLFKESTFVDFQKIKVTESPESLKGGEQAQNLNLHLEGDICGTIMCGDRVILNGVLRSVQKINREGKTVDFTIYMDVNSAEFEEHEFDDLVVTEEDVERIHKELIRDIDKRIVASIAPSIYGYDEVKEAVALQLFGGVAKELTDGTRIRGDIHILLVGDPGIAKSQILTYVCGLAPRGVYASGKSSSSAGLTAAAVRDEDGGWTLEAGALVLADKGAAMLDELDKMKDEDRSALHQAMEQQVIPIAKAGIVTTLRSRCSVLGAANPKMGRFDPYEAVAAQINMPPSLLSRFDLIFTLRDLAEEGRDRAIAKHILNTHLAGEMRGSIANDPASRVSKGLADRTESKVAGDVIEPELLRKYIAYAKRTVHPVMTDPARKRLEEFYLETRKQAYEKDQPIPVTARQLEGLIRLAEASAKMTLSPQVRTEDVERAVRITRVCLGMVGLDRETGKLDVDLFTVGVSKSQRERIKDIKEIVRDLCSREGAGKVAKFDDIVEQAKGHGYEKDRVEKELKKLKEIGELFEPRPGFYAPTS